MPSPLHITHAVLSLDVGGLERIVISLIRSARQRGHRVSVVCVERPGTLAVEAEKEGATVLSLGKPTGRHPEFVQRAARALTELKPDVVHTHQIGAAWYLGQAARGLGIAPVLHTEHGNEFARYTGWWKNLKIRLFLLQAARLVERFCCVSEEIAGAVTKWRTVPRAKVEVVPNGIPTGPTPNELSPASVRAAQGIPEGALVIGTVGRMAEVKRQDLLLRAVAELRQTVPNVHALLVGDGDQRAKLQKLAGELVIADRVHFAGYQASPEHYLRAMDVFALTSRSEGFPVSLLEAWLAGLPTVCSAVGGIPTIVTHDVNGLLFPSGDEGALVKSLLRVLNDSDTRIRLGRAGNQVVHERYSLDRMATEYETRYRSLIAASREPR
ncbi:Putative glycosyltransferase EpsF [Gemmata sp. SH-PL17]|nr:Putative glycosyltransferase EpsF [Gemmata sp. SH-PL17]